MRPLLRVELRRLPTCADPTFTARSDEPLQVAMRRDPWRVAIASMLLCRTRRVQAEPALRLILAHWPTSAHLCRAEAALEDFVKPCGLWRNRANTLRRFSSLYALDGWTELSELPGCGAYVCDAVGLFCFGDTELESSDSVLAFWAGRLCASREAAGQA